MIFSGSQTWHVVYEISCWCISDISDLWPDLNFLLKDQMKVVFISDFPAKVQKFMIISPLLLHQS